jgi:hypothetical protein
MLNYLFTVWKESFNNNKDVLYRFFSLLIRPFSILFTLLYAHIKRYINFLIEFEYKSSIKTTYNLIKNIDFKSFLVWKPLFRK